MVEMSPSEVFTVLKPWRQDQGPVPLRVPRDRSGTFHPAGGKKRQRRLESFDENVLTLYKHGMTTSQIQGPLE